MASGKKIQMQFQDPEISSPVENNVVLLASRMRRPLTATGSICCSVRGTGSSLESETSGLKGVEYTMGFGNMVSPKMEDVKSKGKMDRDVWFHGGFRLGQSYSGSRW